MSAPHSEPPGERPEDALASAAQNAEGGLLREFWEFLRENKKWWLLPILLLLLALGALIVLSGSSVAPFIYRVF